MLRLCYPSSQSFMDHIRKCPVLNVMQYESSNLRLSVQQLDVVRQCEARKQDHGQVCGTDQIYSKSANLIYGRRADQLDGVHVQLRCGALGKNSQHTHAGHGRYQRTKPYARLSNRDAHLCYHCYVHRGGRFSHGSWSGPCRTLERVCATCGAWRVNSHRLRDEEYENELTDFYDRALSSGLNQCISRYTADQISQEAAGTSTSTRCDTTSRGCGGSTLQNTWSRSHPSYTKNLLVCMKGQATTLALHESFTKTCLEAFLKKNGNSTATLKTCIWKVTNATSLATTTIQRPSRRFGRIWIGRRACWKIRGLRRICGTLQRCCVVPHVAVRITLRQSRRKCDVTLATRYSLLSIETPPAELRCTKKDTSGDCGPTSQIHRRCTMNDQMLIHWNWYNTGRVSLQTFCHPGLHGRIGHLTRRLMLILLTRLSALASSRLNGTANPSTAMCERLYHQQRIPHVCGCRELLSALGPSTRTAPIIQLNHSYSGIRARSPRSSTQKFAICASIGWRQENVATATRNSTGYNLSRPM